MHKHIFMYTSESNQKNQKCPDLESKYPCVGGFQGWAGKVQEQPDRLVPESRQYSKDGGDNARGRRARQKGHRPHPDNLSTKINNENGML